MGRITHTNPDIEMEEIRIANRKGFDGLALEGIGAFLSKADELKGAFRNWEHVVLINRPAVAGFSTVGSGQEHAGYIATRHIFDL